MFVFSAHFVFLHQFIPCFLPFFPYFDDMLWKRMFEYEKNPAEAGAQPASAESDQILFF